MQNSVHIHFFTTFSSKILYTTYCVLSRYVIQYI
nr:MAG TPA: hypothetical protein [Caudoviricetes sp.]